MKKQALTTLMLAVLFCAGVAWYNYRVDPYALYQGDAISSESLNRIDLFNHMRLTKPRHVEAIRPTAVVVGSSQSARIPPDVPAWSGERSYNLSVPGMTPYEMRYFVEHAHANGPLRYLMIGIDFSAMIHPEPRSHAGFEASRMARVGRPNVFPNAVRRLSDVGTTLFSLPVLATSLSMSSGATLLPRRYHTDGTWSTLDKMFVGYPGYVYMARQTAQAHESDRLSLEENLAMLAELLTWCHEQDIDTRILFTPLHVFLVDFWQSLGYRDLWREFHIAVVDINYQVAHAAGKEPFPLWGFTHEQGIVDEPIRQRDDSARAWFNEPVHFRELLGQKMMQSVWGDGNGFGRKLTPANIEHYLHDVDELAVRFRQDNLALVSEIHAAAMAGN